MTVVHFLTRLFLMCSYILTIPANTKHLYSICTPSAQRLQRWSNIVQMLYKCLLGREYVPPVGRDHYGSTMQV